MGEDAAATLRLPATPASTAGSPEGPAGGSAGSTGPVGPVEPVGVLEGRGRTVVADAVLERLAARFALDVPDVVRHSSGPPLGGLVTHLPDASAESAGERVRLRLRIAVRWEASAHEVAAAVREEVRRRLGTTTGKTVDRVDVTVSALLAASQVPEDTGRRVR